jgi:hypothetical protein
LLRTTRQAEAAALAHAMGQAALGMTDHDLLATAGDQHAVGADFSPTRLCYVRKDSGSWFAGGADHRVKTVSEPGSEDEEFLPLGGFVVVLAHPVRSS